MFRPIRLSREETRRLWIVVALMTALIVLAILQATLGAMDRTPQPLPNVDTRIATPLPGLLVNPQDQDQTLLVWDALTALHENDYEAAIAMWEGVLLRDYNSFNTGAPDYFVDRFDVDRAGNVWLATGEGGLSRFDGLQWRNFGNHNLGSEPYPFSGNEPMGGYYEDRQGTGCAPRREQTRRGSAAGHCGA